jgi:hypothetical protein
MRPSTRQFIASAGFATLLIVVVFLRMVIRLEPAIDENSRADTVRGLAFDAGFFAAALVLGIGFAGWRLLQARRERANRKPPLDFDGD